MSSVSQTSWINGSLTEAADMLSKRAVVTRKLVDMQKASIDLSEIGSSVGGFLSDNPAVTKALIGAGVGAGVGGLTSVAGPKEERNSLRSMLTGALAGGGLGIGAHYLGKALPDPSSTSTSFEHGGKIHELDPKALSENPAAMRELNELMAARPGEGVMGMIGGLGNEYVSKNPIIASILGADVASQTVGTLAGMSPGSATRISPRVDVLRRGFDLMKDVEDAPGVTKGLEAVNDAMKAGKQPGFKQTSAWTKAVNLVSGAKESTTRSRELLRTAQEVLTTGRAQNGITREIAEQIKVMSDKGQGIFRRGGLESLRDLFRGGPAASGVGQLDIDRMYAGTGVPGSNLLSSRGKIPFTNIDLPKWLGGNVPREVVATQPASISEIIKNVRNKRFGLAGTQVGSSAARGLTNVGNPFRHLGTFGRLAPRAALYAGLPLAQAAFGAARAPGAREKRILKLVKELSK